MLSRRNVAACGAAAAFAAVALAAPGSGPAHDPERRGPRDAKALYVEHCARCHGETGNGEGVEELERPARSFLDGGYSYGNTQTAVVRSVVHGIPGTPMPAFGETLGEDEIAAVADYVIALGPPGTIVEPGASVLTVADRPLVVQGMTPPLRRGAFREPRSLVVGFPNGTTFQYRQTDGTLLAVRQGDFLDRRDWGGRGGQALRPLGAVVWSADGALARADEFTVGGSDAPLTRRIVRSEVRDDSVWLHFDLVDGDGVDVGGGQEILDFLDVDGVPVAVRAVVGTGNTDDVVLRPVETDEAFPAVFDFDGDAPAGGMPTVRRATEGVFVLDPDGAPGLRLYVHAASWSNSLGAAVLDSLTKKD